MNFQWFIICFVTIALLHIFRRLMWGKPGIPGPVAARFSPLYRIWLLLDGKGPINYSNLHKNYGPVVRTGPNHVSLSDSAMIPVVYDFTNHYLKSAFYNVFRPLYRGQPLDTVFTTQEVARNRRLKVALIKNMTGCPYEHLPEIQTSAEVFVRQMRDMQGEVIDMSYWSFFWSFDLTFALIFGNRYGYMQNRSDCNRWIYTFKTITSGAAMLGQIPKWCEWTLANNSFMKFMNHFRSFPDPTQEFIQEIEQRIQSHDDMAHDCDKRFMCRVLASRGKDFNIAEHTEAVNVLFETFFAAAAEVAVTLSTVLYCLLTDAHAYTRLVGELRGDPRFFAPGKLTDYNNAFLTACIKESLRLYPSNSPPMERVVPPSGLQLRGHTISPGTIVSVPQYVAHRDTEIYGSDAEFFRAERWLEADASTLRKMEKNFLAFGRGTRACVGRELATLEIRTLLVNVLKRFDITFATVGSLPEITMFWMLDYIGFKVLFREIA